MIGAVVILAIAAITCSEHGKAPWIFAGAILALYLLRGAVMANLAGLRDLACRYQREAYWANAEAIDLHVALANMGKDPITEQPIRPNAEQIAMSRRFDEAARAAFERASNALQFLLFQQPTLERAA